MAVDLEGIIREQLDLHDGYTVQDLYKLIHQAVFGVAHLLADEHAAFEALKQEYDGLDSMLSGERLLEMIDPRGIVHRVNLRAFRSQRGDLERFWKAVLLTRKEVRGSESRFVSLWDETRRLVRLGSVPFGIEELEKFESETMSRGHPVVHHSESYRSANHPAYRLIASQFLGMAVKR